MRKINVLHILWTGRTGGAERFVRDIVTLSDKEKFNHAICFLAEGGQLAQRVAPYGVPFFELKMRHGFSVAAAFKFFEVLKRFSPRIVHGHTRNYLINIFLMMRPRVLRVYSEHGGCFDPTTTQSDVERYQHFYRLFISHYQLVLTNAEYLREKILAWTGLGAEKVKIYNYGIDVLQYGDRSAREALHQQWGVRAEQKVVGIVGRLVEQKGIDDFVRVCREIDRLKLPCRFVVVGDGPLRESLEDLSKELQVDVLFLGDRQDLPALLPAFDVFVVTSKWEPFGIVLLESLASGVPVAGFKVPGMDAIIEKGGGVLLEGRDHGRLARVTTDIIQDPGRYNAIKEQGLVNVRTHFDAFKNIDLLARDYCDMYDASF